MQYRIVSYYPVAEISLLDANNTPIPLKQLVPGIGSIVEADSIVEYQLPNHEKSKGIILNIGAPGVSDISKKAEVFIPLSAISDYAGSSVSATKNWPALNIKTVGIAFVGMGAGYGAYHFMQKKSTPLFFIYVISGAISALLAEQVFSYTIKKL